MPKSWGESWSDSWGDSWGLLSPEDSNDKQITIFNHDLLDGEGNHSFFQRGIIETFDTEKSRFPDELVEILYPILPYTRNNVRTFRKDNMEWTSVQKSGTYWQKEYCKISFRIRESNLSEFYNFLVSFQAQPLELNLPGVQTFMDAEESNQVYILDFTKPVREKQFYWKITVNFLKDPST